MRAMTLQLFVGSKRYSSWSLRPYLVLAQTGADFVTTTILLDRDTTRDEIAKVTPAGRVPVLHHDGQIIAGVVLLGSGQPLWRELGLAFVLGSALACGLGLFITPGLATFLRRRSGSTRPEVQA